MDYYLLALIAFFVVINIVAFMIMLIDKAKAQNGSTERISEGKMFFLATLFGSVGVYAGMFAFRHKTRKSYFLVGIPLLIVQNCAFLYLVYTLFKS